jgi:hypothetical protein
VTPFPWKPLGAIVADWTLTTLDALHPTVMEATQTAVLAAVPAVVGFAESALPWAAKIIFGSDVQQLGQNVEAAWPTLFDAAWTYAIDAARTAAATAFGPIPVAPTGAIASDSGSD